MRDGPACFLRRLDVPPSGRRFFSRANKLCLSWRLFQRPSRDCLAKVVPMPRPPTTRHVRPRRQQPRRSTLPSTCLALVARAPTSLHGLQQRISGKEAWATWSSLILFFLRMSFCPVLSCSNARNALRLLFRVVWVLLLFSESPLSFAVLCPFLGGLCVPPPPVREDETRIVD